MATFLQIWAPSGAEVVPLAGARLAIGKDPANEIEIEKDELVSRAHAVLERLPSGWCLRDLSSRNGTFVNGERLWGDRPLYEGDEILIGATRLVFRATGEVRESTPTRAGADAPELTRREREVLIELCRPLLTGGVFTGPATIKEIAAALFVTEAAVRQHLLRLSEKLDVTEEGERRRVALANEAIRRAAVSIADLKGITGK